MTYAIQPNLLSFEEFLDWHPEDGNPEEAIGGPKQPTVTVCNLVDGVYELQRFHCGDSILSQALPNLELTVNQIIDAAQSDLAEADVKDVDKLNV